jgi:hypothetical protein
LTCHFTSTPDSIVGESFGIVMVKGINLILN